MITHQTLMATLHQAFATATPVIKATSLNIFTHLISQMNHNGLEFSNIGLELKTVYDAFEKNVVTDPLSATYAVGTLNEIMKNSDTTTSN